MRGNPLRELVIFVLAAVGLWVPMYLMQGPPPDPHAGHGHGPHDHDHPHAHALEIETFSEIRLSHEAAQVRIFRDGELVFEMENQLDDMFDLTIPESGASIELLVTWPEDVETPYAELRLEPDGRKDRVLGFWGGPGEQRQRWFVEPGEEY